MLLKFHGHCKYPSSHIPLLFSCPEATAVYSHNWEQRFLAPMQSSTHPEKYFLTINKKKSCFSSSNFHNLNMACIYIICQEQEDIIEIDFIFLVRWGTIQKKIKTHTTHVRADLLNANSSDLAHFSMKILVLFFHIFKENVPMIK